MSQQPQVDNFSQINLNAIKNTKLFQKFMQNKSALTPKDNNPQKKQKNTLQGPTNNQQHEKELTLTLGQKTKLQNKKWNPKKIQQDHQFREENLPNLNNQMGRRNQVEDFRINKNINNRQNKSLQTVQNERELVNRLQNIKLTHLQQSNEGQNSYVEPYQKMKIGGAYREHENFAQIEHEIPNQSQFVNPTNEAKSGADRNNRRKRNFNSNQFQNNSARKTVNNNFVEQKNQGNDNFLIGTSNQTYEMNNRYIENTYEEKSNKVAIQQQWEVQANNRSYQNSNNYNRSGHQSSPNRLKPTQFPTLTEPGYNSTFQPFASQKPIFSQDSYQNPSQKPQPVHPSFVHISEQDYKSRYESILKKYEQLKLELKTESKNHKKQFTSWEHQIQMLKEKLFSVQSREDSLLIENQRFKQKYEAEAMNKLKTQEQNKELTYKIKQLQDQLNMKQHTLRQKNQELNFWKSQTQAMKQQLNSLRLMLQKRNDQLNLIQGDYQILKKQRDNKDYLLQELRKNVGILVEENSAAKDEIFSLVTKLYQLEQHNQVLKNDLKRQSMDHSHLNTYLQQIQQKQSQVQRLHQQSMGNRQRTVSTQQQRPPFERYEHTNNRVDRSFTAKNQSYVGQNHHKERYEQKPTRSSLTEQQNPNVVEKPTRRRGQFARQRGQVVKNDIKAERDERPINGVKQNISNMNVSHDNRVNQPVKPSFSSNDNKIARIQSISEELQKIKDLKAMNGAIRRRKIDLQRELQQLQAQIH